MTIQSECIDAPPHPPLPPELFPSSIFLQRHYCFQTCKLLLRQQQNSTSVCCHRSSSSAEQRLMKIYDASRVTTLADEEEEVT